MGRRAGRDDLKNGKSLTPSNVRNNTPSIVLYGCLQRVTIPEAVVIQFVLLRMSSVLLETC